MPKVNKDKLLSERTSRAPLVIFFYFSSCTEKVRNINIVGPSLLYNWAINRAKAQSKKETQQMFQNRYSKNIGIISQFKKYSG